MVGDSEINWNVVWAAFAKAQRERKAMELIGKEIEETRAEIARQSQTEQEEGKDGA